jgi:hypothetical protein
MKRIFLAAALVLAAGAPARAADRLFDLIGVDGTEAVFIDINSKAVSKPTVQFWVLFTNPTGRIAEAFPTVHYMVSRVQLDCDAKTSQVLESILYGKSDEVLVTANEPSNVRPVDPGSYGDTELRYVCQGVRPHPEFTMRPQLKDAVAWADDPAGRAKR